MAILKPSWWQSWRYQRLSLVVRVEVRDAGWAGMPRVQTFTKDAERALQAFDMAAEAIGVCRAELAERINVAKAEMEQREP